MCRKGAYLLWPLRSSPRVQEEELGNSPALLLAASSCRRSGVASCGMWRGYLESGQPPPQKAGTGPQPPTHCSVGSGGCNVCAQLTRGEEHKVRGRGLRRGEVYSWSETPDHLQPNGKGCLLVAWSPGWGWAETCFTRTQTYPQHRLEGAPQALSPDPSPLPPSGSVCPASHWLWQDI